MNPSCTSVSPVLASFPIAQSALAPARPSPPSAAHPIAVISADPQERDRLMSALGRAPRLHPAGCHSGADGLTADTPLRDSAVDLVLYEVSARSDPHRLRSEVAMLRARLPGARVVGLVSADEPHHASQAILAGMDGCIFRPARLDRLTHRLLGIAQGETPLCPRMAEYLMASLRQTRQASKPSPSGVTPSQLTRRERDVVRLLARGLAYKEVADVLNIGLETVRSHVRRLYRKLGIHTAAEAAVWAVRNGMAED